MFRFRPYQKKGFQDFIVREGDVVVVPAMTNQHWTNEVPKFKRYRQRRISVTLRAYEQELVCILVIHNEDQNPNKP